jgi:pyruvate carboxylase
MRAASPRPKAAFGSDGVYVERLIRKARHIEVQIIGDRHGAISHLWERECTIQRRNQKLIEVAPSPSLSEALALRASSSRQAARGRRALRQSRHLRIPGRWRRHGRRAFAFIEANPRLQVEHTVTEEVLGVDLVKSQLAVAAGATLGLARPGAGLYPGSRAAMRCSFASTWK